MTEYPRYVRVRFLYDIVFYIWKDSSNGDMVYKIPSLETINGKELPIIAFELKLAANAEPYKLNDFNAAYRAAHTLARQWRNNQ